MLSSEEIDLKVFNAVYRSKALTPIPPPLTHCMYTCMQYILIPTGQGGKEAELNQREGRGASAGSKKPT
jgi:hypothetical protein